tara:strand:- start:2301 stop:2567 length:267 start_codon:yes stop_codon:yes gene_type:complete
MEDFIQIFSYITATLLIGVYINRLRPNIKNNNLKNKIEYNEIKDFNILPDTNVIMNDSITKDIENNSDNISDISSSTSDEEFIIINEV